MKKKTLEYKPIVNTLDWRIAFWIQGYAKTISTSMLASTGLVSIKEGLELNNPLVILFGFSLIACAFVSVFIIDLYGERKKREELEEIDKRNIELHQVNQELNEKIDAILMEKYEERGMKFLEMMEENND